MRGWIILFETIVAIILLTSAYLIFLNRYRDSKSLQDIYITEETENLRNLIDYCFPNKVYILYNFTSNNYIICINGSIGSLNDLDNYVVYKRYLFSGYKEYNPTLLILYR